MISSGENAIFVNKPKGKKYMLSDSTCVRVGVTPEESKVKLDDRFDDMIYSKPVAFVKKMSRKLKKRYK